MRRPAIHKPKVGLLATALNDPRWFGDTLPRWTNYETGAQAESRHDTLLRLMRRYADASSISRVLEHLEVCTTSNPCLSGACPRCLLAFQRLCTAQIDGLLKANFTGSPVHAVSLIVDVFEQLNASMIACYERQAKLWLFQAGVKHAFGGWDFSFNQPSWSSKGGEWAYQLWLLVPGFTKEMKSALRSIVGKDPKVYRPLKASAFDGNLDGIAYAFKTDFVRRVSYVQEKEVDGRIRRCRNTTAQKLRVSERLELYPFLDDLGLDGRVFLTGARPVRTKNGIAIRLFGGKAKNSENDEKRDLKPETPS
jgi:hypothetical protein